MAFDDPRAYAVNFTPVSEATLETTDKEEEEAHGEQSIDEHGTTTPLVDVDDSRDGRGYVENVLNGSSDETGATSDETNTTEDIGDVVPRNQK